MQRDNGTGWLLLLSDLFATDLQFAHFGRIFASAKGAYTCSLFLVSTSKRGLFYLALECHLAQLQVNCGPFAMSFELGGNFEGVTAANGANKIGSPDGCRKIPCKAFSKHLIVSAIY